MRYSLVCGLVVGSLFLGGCGVTGGSAVLSGVDGISLGLSGHQTSRYLDIELLVGGQRTGLDSVRPMGAWVADTSSANFEPMYRLGHERVLLDREVAVDPLRPTDVMIEALVGRVLRAGDYQSVRFVPPAGGRIESVVFNATCSLGPSMSFELWSGGAWGRRSCVWSSESSGSGATRIVSPSLPEWADRWFEFRLAVGSADQRAKEDVGVNLAGPVIHAIIGDVRVNYRRAVPGYLPGTLVRVEPSGTLTVNGREEAVSVPVKNGQARVKIGGHGRVRVRAGSVRAEKDI